MKKSIKEELKRIHTISYGKNIITESFLDDILKKTGLKKVDDPSKADLVTDDVSDFFKNLQDTISDGGLKQQEQGSMSFQKNVETMQIALLLLGYDLPKHGVDGLFGEETANAVEKFKKDNSIINESASELRSTLNQLNYDEKGNEITSGGEITDEMSKFASDVLKDFKKLEPKIDVVITAGNDRYHQKLSYKSKHVTGQAIDVVLKPYSSKVGQQFKSILEKYKQKDSNFNYIDEYTNPSSASTGGHFHLQYGDGDSKPIKNKQLQIATPEMLKALYLSLKRRGVTSNEIKQYVDKYKVEQNTIYTRLLEMLDAPITVENLRFLSAWKQAEGKGGENNPFNTTWDLPGSVKINKDGVRSYQSIEDGLIATVKTLKNKRYECIVNGLKNDIGAENISKCESLKIWGTGDLVGKVLKSPKYDTTIA